MSKYRFECSEIVYLGHYISTDGVKLKAMLEWSTPTNVKSLFLRLIVYYWRFIKGYGGVATTLTKLLKKDELHWGLESEEAFLKLKELVTQLPILALLDFSQGFNIECDASGKAVGAVLMKKGHLIAFYSHALNSKALNLSTYEREFFALVLAIQKSAKELIYST